MKKIKGKENICFIV